VEQCDRNAERTLVCHCGEKTFRVRLHPEESVGPVTCAAQHYSLLLDSRD
jgi:hypothetical protein